MGEPSFLLCDNCRGRLAMGSWLAENACDTSQAGWAGEQAEKEDVFLVNPFGGLHLLRLDVARLVGREKATCALRIPAREVSRTHAILQWNETLGCAVVTDLGSGNGTCIDGVAVPPHVPESIADAAVLSFGGIEFCFRYRPNELEVDPSVAAERVSAVSRSASSEKTFRGLSRAARPAHDWRMARSTVVDLRGAHLSTRDFQLELTPMRAAFLDYLLRAYRTDHDRGQAQPGYRTIHEILRADLPWLADAPTYQTVQNLVLKLRRHAVAHLGARGAKLVEGQQGRGYRLGALTD